LPANGTEYNMWRQTQIAIATRGRGFHHLTEAVAAQVRAAGLQTGLCHVFLRHTSATLCISENADPEVQHDLERFAERLARDGDPLFQHDAEGPDDMPAHVRSLAFGYQLTVPIEHGRLGLGTWQGIYLWEHRKAGRRRELIVTLCGDARDQSALSP
jgi:secondary thiamine-phosphate synthase enzyme